MELSNEENLSDTEDMIRNIPQLPRLLTIKPYVVYFIHRNASPSMLHEIITEAKQTERFTFVPKYKSIEHDTMSMRIELIQQTVTVLVSIDYSHEKDKRTLLYDTLCQFFSIIFHSSNLVQPWDGNLMHKLKPFLSHGIFTINQIKLCRSSDIQQEFKRWYNQTFIHQICCQHYLQYDDIDGPFCSCTYRPYKYVSAQWSLLKAVAYTFNEYLYDHTFDITKCLAITKLADVIEQQWTIQQVQEYKMKYHIAQKVIE